MKKIYLVVSYDINSDDTSTFHFLDKSEARAKYSEILKEFGNRYDFYKIDYYDNEFRGCLKDSYATASIKLIEIDINL